MKAVQFQERHLMSHTPENGAWRKMKGRCFNKNNKDYSSYGGRGITVHSAWVNDFKAFYDYMGARPSNRHSVDRIDNDGNYEPGNVRWATPLEQKRNQGLYSNSTTGVKGVNWNKESKKYIARINVMGKSVFLGYFKNLEDAVATRLEAEGRLWC